MSWRLEERDLSGEWCFNKQDLRSVLEAVAEYSQNASDSAYTEDELCKVIAVRGDEWHQWWTKHPHEASNPYLGFRLDTVRRLIPHGTANVDIGTDHAHLPVSAVRSGQSSCAIGIDIALAPLLSARNVVERAALGGRVGLLLGDGLHPLIEGKGKCADHLWISSLSEEGLESWSKCYTEGLVAVTICGVGGGLAAHLLNTIPLWVSTVIIQANDQPLVVDQMISQLCKDRDFNLTATEVTIDRGRLFLTKRIEQITPSSHMLNSPMLWLWRWLDLSRAARRVSRTPDHHASIQLKRVDLAQALDRFFCTF